MLRAVEVQFTGSTSFGGEFGEGKGREDPHPSQRAEKCEGCGTPLVYAVNVAEVSCSVVVAKAKNLPRDPRTSPESLAG
jgi:hypothetical protein